MAAVHILILLSRIIETIFKLRVSFIPIVTNEQYFRQENIRNCERMNEVWRRLKRFEKESLEIKF